MKVYSRILLTIALFAFSFSASAQLSLLENLPLEAHPREIGDRIVYKFLKTPHTRFGNPRAEKAPNYITYPDACAWLGALRYAKATGNEQMTDRLVRRFEPLFSTEKHLLPRMNHVDHNVVGAVPLEIYIQGKGSKEYYDLGMKYADTQWEVPADAKPEQKDYADKGYSWQTRIWIDDMFMITTIQTQAYRATGDPKYLDRTAKEMVLYLGKIQRPNGLFYHAPEAPFFWARGNGWMAAGMAGLLSVLPENHEDYPVIMKAYKKMMKTLKEYQGKEGLWHQLIDEEEAWNETSGTAMFTYAMIVGVKHGWLDAEEYAPVARKGWLGLVSYINKDDEVENVCEGTNIKNDKNHYMNRKRITGDLHAHAPLLWCATELVTIDRNPDARRRRGTSQGDLSARLDYEPGSTLTELAVPLAETVMARYPDYRTAYWKDYTYVQGYMFEAMDRLGQLTGDGKYLQYIKMYMDRFVDEEGNYKGGALTNLDNFMTGSAFCTLYKRTGDERYKKAALQILEAVAGYPQTDGQFWHGNKSPNMWIDGVFMMQMFLIRCAQYVGEADYCLDIACRNVLAAARHLQRPDGLLLHAWTTQPEKVKWADKQTGLSPEVWSEGMGWYALVVPELLAVLPSGHAQYDAVLSVYRQMIKGLEQTQDVNTGGWFMVVDKKENPLNFIDPSGTAMFVYSVQRGIDLGLLDALEFAPVAERGYRCLFPFVRVNDRGLLDVTGACDGVTVKPDFYSYVTLNKVPNAKEAVAGILWAAVIMEKSLLP